MRVELKNPVIKINCDKRFKWKLDEVLQKQI